MISLSKFHQLIRTGGVDDADFEKAKTEILNSNRAIVKGFSLLTTVILAILFVVSCILPSFAGYRPLYAGAFAVALIIWLIAVFPGKHNQNVMLIDVYLFSALLLTLGVVLGTVFSPTELAATYIAFLLTVPQVFTDRPYRMYILIVLSVVVFIVTCIHIKDPATWNSDVTNALVFGVISLIFCTYSVSNRISRYCLEQKNRFLAENDQLTGLKNRYCYETLLSAPSVSDSGSVYCVYIDVNGLHELNNAKGHEAGDRMLQYVASIVRHLFGEENSYRIGGDEFVVLGTGKGPDEISETVASLRQAVESAGYHVANGVSCREQQGFAMNAVVSEAEKDMYTDKTAYYRTNGIDRRRSR